MIQCSECGFSVNETMKFALMQNICPSCGSALFSIRDSNLISTIQGKLSSQRFSNSLDEELSYDISLFVFNELKHGLGKLLMDEVISKYKNKSSEGSDESGLHDESGESSEDVRTQVEAELAAEIARLTDNGDIIIEDSEVFPKAERLKKLREQQLIENPNLGKKPVTSRRRTGFGGISRSG